MLRFLSSKCLSSSCDRSNSTATCTNKEQKLHKSNLKLMNHGARECLSNLLLQCLSKGFRSIPSFDSNCSCHARIVPLQQTEYSKNSKFSAKIFQHCSLATRSSYILLKIYFRKDKINLCSLQELDGKGK